MLDNVDLFAIAESKARDNALAQILSNSGDWDNLAIIELRELSHYSQLKEFTTTHIRFWLVPLIGKPHNPNCWGAFIMKAIKDGIIKETGEFRRTGAHARKQTVYRWV